MNQGKLTNLEFEELSSYMDGELDAAQTERIEQLVRSDAAWAGALSELEALDEALGGLSAPAPPAYLPDTIITAVRRSEWRRRAVRVGWLAGPLAAAAAIVLVAVIMTHKSPTTNLPTGVSHNADVNVTVCSSEQDEMIVENLDFFRDYNVVENFETLEAIERMEAASAGM